jgi:hypothetical protein
MSDWGQGGDSGTSVGPSWVTAADAADAAGVTPDEVRSWAARGEIVSQEGAGPAGATIMVRLDEVMSRASGSGAGAVDLAPVAASPVAPAPSGQDGHVDMAPLITSIPDLMGQVASATDRAARAETKVEFLRQQMAEMRKKLSGHEDWVHPEDWDLLNDGSEEEAPAEPAEVPEEEEVLPEPEAASPETVSSEPTEPTEPAAEVEAEGAEERSDLWPARSDEPTPGAGDDRPDGWGEQESPAAAREETAVASPSKDLWSSPSDDEASGEPERPEPGWGLKEDSGVPSFDYGPPRKRRWWRRKG